MRKVILSKRAANKLEKLLNYLETEWSAKVKSEFIYKFNKSVNTIRKYPESCKQTNIVKGLRMLVVTKQTSVFYNFNDKSIHIVSIFDTRMNPNKLKKEI